MWKFTVLLGFLTLSLFGCRVQPPRPSSSNTYAQILQATLDTSQAFKKAHVGILLVDDSDTLFSYQAQKYFIPASTTKLFTFYASLISLPELLPGAFYEVKDDSLFFWGTGEPTAFHPDFGNDVLYQWLRQQSHRTLVYSDAHFKQKGLGLGWAWDDYDAYYSPEMSALPLFGNVAWFQNSSSGVQVTPPLFQSTWQVQNNGKTVQRALEDNIFSVPSSILTNSSFRQEIPFKTSGALTQQFLSDTLNRWVSYRSIPLSPTYQTLFTQPADTVYKYMLGKSDNFLAEQLLLMAGASWEKVGNTVATIDTLLKGPLNGLPDRPRWVDGSGLSRYNLQTPRNLIHLLGKLQDTLSQDQLFEYLPATHRPESELSDPQLKDPFVYAKSGSMSGVYNLAGFIRTPTGRLLRFAIMTNQFHFPVSRMRTEVNKILQLLYAAPH